MFEVLLSNELQSILVAISIGEEEKGNELAKAVAVDPCSGANGGCGSQFEIVVTSFDNLLIKKT